MKERAVNAGRRVKKIFFMMLVQFEDPYYQGVAAQIAFSLFLSIVPTMILISQLLGLFSLSLHEIKLWVDTNVSVEGADKLLSFLAVSYTHLDVYKRQAGGRIINNITIHSHSGKKVD